MNETCIIYYSVNRKEGDSILAETYAKGCKICLVKEKKLEEVFSDSTFVYTDNKEELKSECYELLRKKGLIYAVYFKKRLIGLYLFKCENLDLILVRNLTNNMEDLVKAEVEKSIKLLLHAKITNGKYEKAFWNEEVIDIKYATTAKSYMVFILMLLILNLVVLILNILKNGNILITVCLSVVIVMYIMLAIYYFVKRK